MADKITHSDFRNRKQGNQTKPASVKERRNRKMLSSGERGGSTAKRLLGKIRLTCPDILMVINLKKKQAEDVFSLASEKKGEKKDFLEKMPEEDKEKLWETLTNSSSFCLDEYGETEVRLTAQNGEFKFYNLRFTPESIENDGTINSWFCQARDITENKKQFKELGDSKLKLQMALEGSGMGIWSYDPRLQKIECDDRCCSMFGLSQAELDGDVNKIFSRIHPEDRSFAISTVIGSVRGKGRFYHDFRVIPGESSIVRHISVIGELITNEQAELSKITGICLNVSLSKLSENQIKINETFLEESQRIANIGCFDWDLVLDKIQLTPQIYKVLGMSARSTISLAGFLGNVHPGDRSGVEKALKDSVKNGGRFSREFRYCTNDGEMKILWAQGQVSRRVKNFSTRLIGSIQDISERKKNEKELNTQNLIIRSILDSLPVIIRIIDKNGVIIKLLGEAGLNRIGMTENQTVGKNILECEPETGKYIRQVLNGKTINFTEQIKYNNRSFHFFNYYFLDKERELAIGFSLDISAQKNTEAAFQDVAAKNRELERNNKVMDLFVYAAAHDLKNPINNLEIISDLMKEATTPGEQEEYLKALTKSVKRLKQTIFGLTEIIVIENSKDLKGTILKFNDVLEQVKEDLESKLQEKNAKIITDFRQATIRYNAPFLTSIMKNLLSNAIKYSDDSREPEIKICAEQKNGFINLSFSDNGIGIDLPQYQQNLFKPFKRFTSQAEGTGVGLHLIKNMIEKNGGHIEIESTPGKGTTFSCFLVPYSISKDL